MTGLTYTTYVSQIATLAVVEPTNTAFVEILPQMINYAELRIQRDLDLLSTQISNSTYSATTNNEIVALNPADFITIQSVSLSSTTPHTPLLPVTKEFLQYNYPMGTTTGAPQYFAMYGGDKATGGQTAMNIRLGPIPDQNYTLNITGTLHAAPLSVANPTTFISTYLPDLFIMASMIYVTGYQRNWSATSDDNQMAVNYEKQYQTLLIGAKTEEFRKKFQASAWSSLSTSPVATPTR